MAKSIVPQLTGSRDSLQYSYRLLVLYNCQDQKREGIKTNNSASGNERLGDVLDYPLKPVLFPSSDAVQCGKKICYLPEFL